MAGKCFLFALAEAFQALPYSNANWDIEEAAWQILETLWQSEDSSPDVECINAYLYCLEGHSPEVVADKAEAIARAMKSGQEFKGRILPKPNVETMNALIQLRAHLGGVTGRYDKVGEDFVPNRRSFLSILSSNIYHERVNRVRKHSPFDVEFARHCIERMEELYKENLNDISLRPDTQVYNAPLFWTGGSLFRRSRPYARFVPFEHRIFHRIKEKGLVEFDENDESVVDARNVELWMEEMIASENEWMLPDIETYEAVILRWIRTTSKEGLERAEHIARSLLDHPDHILECRLLTFRPLLAAWTVSGLEDGCAKVDSLIQTLESASTTNLKLQPDGKCHIRTIQSMLSTLI